MGIISSTFASLAIQLAWNYQRLLDPRYRCVDDKRIVEYSPPPGQKITEVNEVTQTIGISRNTENKLSLHQENRKRRAAQLMYKRRPSSFDASLILKSKNKICVRSVAHIVSSKSNPFRRQRTVPWEVTSSSGCSPDSDSDSVSETELRISGSYDEIPKDGESRKEVKMSAEDKAAFRMTVGRGHFSQSKKDRFLNNLRLEKRLNEMNSDHYSAACRAHCHTLPR